ncbi:hypothetical protein BUALT_Bualt14G0063100 [Buddleja alternifolia]|uniref:Transposase Tnp1/En/Spm-like domain-containing protein n=1 Tax=Buddleja alternifolia TaxID=168488 RepID=A0AAV6WPD7_9LAMI|nr:hypothetical protein BUALT_Bualt14G0063100 [Buddleja alternifolia]
MVHEAVKIPSTNVDVGFSQISNNEMNEETKKFFKLLQDAETELLPGCAKQTKLSFVVRLLQLKALCGWTNKSIDLLLELLKDSFPDGVNIPANYYEAQKITNDLIANKVNPLADTCGTQLSTDKDTPPAKQQPRPYPDFPMPHELIYEKNMDAPTQGNKNVPHYVVAGNATEINTFDCRPVEVGNDVILFCSEIPKEIVAEGMLLSMDPNEKIDEFALGHEYVKVVIKKAMKPDYFLIRPRRGISTIRQAVGKSVAWEYVNVMEK